MLSASKMGVNALFFPLRERHWQATLGGLDRSEHERKGIEIIAPGTVGRRMIFQGLHKPLQTAMTIGLIQRRQVNGVGTSVLGAYLHFVGLLTASSPGDLATLAVHAPFSAPIGDEPLTDPTSSIRDHRSAIEGHGQAGGWRRNKGAPGG